MVKDAVLFLVPLNHRLLVFDMATSHIIKQ
jgi:hypothetical protein